LIILSKLILFLFQSKENTHTKTGPKTEERMLKPLRNANVIKSYRRTKRCKRNDVSEQLASSIYYLFYSLNVPGNAAAKQNGKKKRRDGRHNESEKLAVNIERVIHSLKNT